MADTVFFIGDTHFGHKRVIELSSRPFISLEEMEEKLVNNWNQKIKKEYTVFMVGDFALANKDTIIRVGQRLNGRKTLILGNHDTASMKTYYEAGFEFVSKHPIIYDGVIVTHIPYFNVNRGDFKHIFAHMHNRINPKMNENYINGFCVSAEEVNYTPIGYDEILKKTGWFS